jgi:hypothetical protein
VEENPLELMDIVYTSGFRIEGRTEDRARARPSGRSAGLIGPAVGGGGRGATAQGM